MADIKQASQVSYLVELLTKDVLRKDCLKKFCKKYGVSEGRFNRLYPIARKLVDERIKAGIDASNEAYTATKAKLAVNEVISQQEAKEILSKIAKGTVTKYGDVVMIPTQAEKIKAVDTLAKLEGWITNKVDHTTNGKELPATPTITKVILKI